MTSKQNLIIRDQKLDENKVLVLIYIVSARLNQSAPGQNGLNPDSTTPMPCVECGLLSAFDTFRLLRRYH